MALFGHVMNDGLTEVDVTPLWLASLLKIYGKTD
jgi:hypothetical protein